MNEARCLSYSFFPSTFWLFGWVRARLKDQTRIFWWCWLMLINAIATCESFLGSPDNPNTTTSKWQSSNGNFMTNEKKLPLVKLDFLNSQHNCENGFWDPLAGRCYNTSCGYHYQFQNGHCIFRNISQTLPCPQKNEFRWWEVRYNFFLASLSFCTSLSFFQKGNSPMDLFFIRDTKLCSTARTTKSTISKWARVAGATSIESTKFAQQNLWSTFQLFKVPKNLIYF